MVVHCLSFKLIRHAPPQIPFLALNITSWNFGGTYLTDSYASSAHKNMDAQQLVKYLRSGSLFRLRTDIRGLTTFESAG
jgi:sugar lactone lactonase YvrE